MAHVAFRHARPRGEFRRAQILKAATAVFLENGYGGATIDLVVSCAGASKATIYSFFGGKEGLFGAIVDDCSERLLATFQTIELTDIDVDVPKALAQIGRQYMDLTLTPEVIGIYRLILAEGVRFPELARTFYQLGPDRVAAHISAIFANWQTHGLIHLDDTQLTAVQFVDAVGGDLHLRVVAGLVPADIADIIERRIQSAAWIFGNAIACPIANDGRPDHR